MGPAVFREGGEVTYSHLILVMDLLCSGKGSGTGRLPRGRRGDLFLSNLIDGLTVFCRKWEWVWPSSERGGR